MANVLLFVHGMGHPETNNGEWHVGPMGVLKAAAEEYGVADRLDARVRSHGITYDTVFRDTLAEIGTSVDELKEAMEENAVDGLQAVHWLDDQDITETESNFFWSHVVDVLLYRFFPQVATEVRTRVMHEFVRIVNDAEEAAEAEGEPRPQVAVIAHSLGTSVIHDALAELATKPLGGSGAYLANQGWRLDHLFMLANVSRVLSRLGPAFYQSTVRCQTAPDVPGVAPCVEKYFNFRHALDPIPAVKAFSPAGWGSDFKPVTVDHFLDWNVHGYEHYLRHPDVHVPILNELVGYRITAEQHQGAVAELASAPLPECLDVVDRLRTRLRRARDLVQSLPAVDASAAVALIKVAAEVLALVEEAKTECQELVT